MVNGPWRLQVQTWARCHIAMFPSWRASAWDRQPRHQRSTGNSPRPAQCRIKICLTEKATFSLHQQLLCLFYFRADLQLSSGEAHAHKELTGNNDHTSQWQLLATLHSNSIIHKLPHSLQTLRPMTTCIFAGHEMSSYFRDTAVFQPRHRVFGCFLCSSGVCRKNHPNHSAAPACTTHYTLKAQQWPSHLWQHRPRPVSWHQITTTHNACCMGYFK